MENANETTGLGRRGLFRYGTNTSGRARLAAAERCLPALRAELVTMLQQTPWDTQTQVRAAALRDEIEFLLLGSELVAGAVLSPNVEATLSWFMSADLSELLISAVAASPSLDSIVERARRIDLSRLHADRRGAPRELQASGERARRIIAMVDDALGALLARIGGRSTPHPRLAFVALLSRIDDVETGERLHDAWQALRARHRDELIEAVESHVEVLRMTMSQTKDQSNKGIDDFIEDLLAEACRDSAALEVELHEALPVAARPLDHVGRLALRTFDGSSVPLVSLLECLQHGAELVADLLSVEIQIVSAGPLSLRVLREGSLEGEIIIDPWSPGSSNSTVGLRNRTDYLGIQQHPIAYVRCGFRRVAPGSDLISLQSALGILHEFGHAIQHVLVRGALPALSGMDSLPSSHREIMALWSEKLIYRPGLSLPSGWRTVKSLEIRRGLVERAVIAAIDRSVLGLGTEASVVAAFERLDLAHGVSRFCSLFDVLEHFAQASTSVTGGSYYAYAWGAVESCAAAGDAPRAAWLDPDLPMAVPRASDLVDFYREIDPGSPEIVEASR